MTKRICEWCGNEFEAATTGRPPKYCRKSHGQRAYEQRRNNKTVTAIPAQEPTTGLGEWTPAETTRWDQHLVTELRNTEHLAVLAPNEMTKPTAIRPTVEALIEIITRALGAIDGFDVTDPIQLARSELITSAAWAVTSGQEILRESPRSAKQLLQRRQSLLHAAALLADPPVSSSLRAQFPDTNLEQSKLPAGDQPISDLTELGARLDLGLELKRFPRKPTKTVPTPIPPAGTELPAGVFLNAYQRGGKHGGKSLVFWKLDSRTEAGEWVKDCTSIATSHYKLRTQPGWEKLGVVMVVITCGYADQPDTLPPGLEAAARLFGRFLQSKHGASEWRVTSEEILDWLTTERRIVVISQ